VWILSEIAWGWRSEDEAIGSGEKARPGVVEGLPLFSSFFTPESANSSFQLTTGKYVRHKIVSDLLLPADIRPLPVKIAIRDTFDKDTSEVKQALKALNDEVGYDFNLVVPWADIHRDLSPLFTDVNTLVPSVCSALIAYMNRIVKLLDDQTFQDAFLEKMSSYVSRDIYVRVGEQQDMDSSEFDRNERFTFSLPQSGPQWYRTMLPRVGHDLEDVFLDRKPVAAPGGGNGVSVAAIAPNDWVDLDVGVATITNKIRSLPTLYTLGKPESLFPSVLPYYVIASTSGAHINIESSHQKTIDLVHSYFQLHTRKNMRMANQVPGVYI
jgi:hypothetical protein